jgi:hypothetical protein
MATFLNFFVLACLAACSGLPFCLTSARFPANLAPLRTKERTPGVYFAHGTQHTRTNQLCVFSTSTTRSYSVRHSSSWFWENPKNKIHLIIDFSYLF